MSQNLTYGQLEEYEKVALEVAIVFLHHTLSAILPKLFGWKASSSTYYRYHRRGVDKLKEKGILDEKGNPTNLAFEILPIENLRKMIMDISKEMKILEKRRQDEYARSLEYEQKYRDIQKRCEQLGEENRIMKEQLETLEELQKIKEKFDFRNPYNRVKFSLPEQEMISVAEKKRIHNKNFFLMSTSLIFCRATAIFVFLFNAFTFMKQNSRFYF